MSNLDRIIVLMVMVLTAATIIRDFLPGDNELSAASAACLLAEEELDLEWQNQP